MYAIRSYYDHEPFAAEQHVGQGQAGFGLAHAARVITSYSIHYTKLYDAQTADAELRAFKMLQEAIWKFDIQ